MHKIDSLVYWLILGLVEHTTYFLIFVVGKKKVIKKMKIFDFNTVALNCKHRKGSMSANWSCLNVPFDMPCGPFIPGNVTSSFYINGF